MADSGRDSPGARGRSVRKKELSGLERFVMSTPEDFRTSDVSNAFLSARELENSLSRGSSLSRPIQEESSSKAFSARDLQERILSERDRINSKRDRLQQQRTESLEPKDSIYDATNDTVESTVIVIPDEEGSVHSDTPPSVTSSLPLDELRGSQGLVDDDTDDDDEKFVNSRDIFISNSMTTAPSTPPPKVQPLTTRKRRVSKGANQQSCWNRKFMCGIFCSLFAITSLTVTLCVGFAGNGTTKSSTNSANTTSCQQATNIVSECICQDDLPEPLSEVVDYNRKLVLKYLTIEGALDADYGNTTSATSCDVHNQALLWVSDLKNHLGPSPPTNLQLLQRYTLAVMYQNLNGNNWKHKEQWLVPTSSECNWEGVVCSSTTSEILELHLQDNNLNGTVPLVELGQLTSLRQLMMNSNLDLIGTLSSELMMLPLLQSIQLSATSVSGNFPTELGSRLAELELASTKLKGTLPTELGSLSRLRLLDLSSNRFTGTLPTQLQGLTQMEYLDVSANRLNGSLPTVWDSPFLETMNLNDNIDIRGPYPQPYSSGLSFVNFAATALSGTVPDAYCGLTYLQSIIVDCTENNTKPCQCCRCS